MMGLLALVILVGTLGTLFYRDVSRPTGSLVFLVVWVICGFIGGWPFNWILLILMLAALFVINHIDLRRGLLVQPVFRFLKKSMPPIGDTEREAIEAGTTWFEAELFSGTPDWEKFSNIHFSTLTDEEQSFLDNEVEELCGMLNEWEIFHELRDLPEPVWTFLKKKGFFSLIIPRDYGGKAFSPYAQSRVMSKIASRSLACAVTAMVPNSLGPGELLARYGTDEQKQRWLPALAAGNEIPCFGLTGPEAGSDAGSIPDTGVVCKGKINGEEVLGMRLNFAKRWITLAPIATVVGLAFKLKDPNHLLGDEEELGITCALIPADTKGIEIGRRHNPGSPFMNGPINGHDVFVSLEAIIGGPEMAGKGWRMLIECLGAGRGISLPALATASGEVSYCTTGAFARIRQQFNMSVGKFEGVQDASARVAGLAYTLEAWRHLVTRSLEDGTPSVVTAMAKYHATEMMRELINHSMDIFGGRGIQLGPRNFQALAYQATPIAITVEGANILTRSLMIFGQGALRCHPFLYDEMQTLNSDNLTQALERFDDLFMAHAAHALGNASRAAAFAWAGHWLTTAPVGASDFGRPWYQLISRYAAVLAATSDVALGLLGGDLKRRELLSARLGDVLSQLLIACSLLKYHETQSPDEAQDVHARYALHLAMSRAHDSLDAFYRNFHFFGVGRILKAVFFPLGRPCLAHAPPDDLIRQLGAMIMEPTSVRKQLAAPAYIPKDAEDAVGRVEVTYQKLLKVEPFFRAYQKAAQRGELSGKTVLEKLKSAAEQGIIPADKVEAVHDYDNSRYDCLLTDAFDRKLKKVDVRNERPL
jgi:acyl-CoA dehydrogenase